MCDFIALTNSVNSKAQVSIYHATPLATLKLLHAPYLASIAAQICTSATTLEHFSHLVHQTWHR